MAFDMFKYDKPKSDKPSGAARRFLRKFGFHQKQVAQQKAELAAAAPMTEAQQDELHDAHQQAHEDYYTARTADEAEFIASLQPDALPALAPEYTDNTLAAMADPDWEPAATVVVEVAAPAKPKRSYKKKVQPVEIVSGS